MYRPVPAGLGRAPLALGEHARVEAEHRENVALGRFRGDRRRAMHRVVIAQPQVVPEPEHDARRRVRGPHRARLGLVGAGRVRAAHEDGGVEATFTEADGTARSPDG